MARYELLIFDWDGTLVDSIGRIVSALRRAADDCGLPPLEEATLRGIIGLAMPEVAKVLYPQLVDAAEQVRFIEAYSDHYLASEAHLSVLYPGVAEGLLELRGRGHRLAVATGKSRRGLDRVMHGHGYGNFFDVTRCADETASKPDPRMLHEILAHCGVLAERALMIGDSIFDLQMANRAGVDGLGVSYGAQSGEILAECRPIHLIDDFAELAEWLA